MPSVLSKFARILFVKQQSWRSTFADYWYNRSLTLNQKFKEINLYDDHPLSPYNQSNRETWGFEYDHPSPHQEMVYDMT